MLQKNWMELIKPSKMDVNVQNDNNKKGVLIAEPLERGFGLTLGNSIRRVLLLLSRSSNHFCKNKRSCS